MAFCKSCGKKIDDGVRFCPNCGADSNTGTSTNQNTQIVEVENHLVKAILTTIFCCVPFGIVSIIYAASVNGKAQSGDVQGAIRASNSANTWANWSIVLGLVIGVIYIIASVAAEM